MGTNTLLRTSLIFSLAIAICGGQLRTTEESSEEERIISGSYVLPKQIFNEGKPFYVDKDPISGQLDFSSKKPAGIEPEANEVIDPKEKIVLNNSSPNIHDFLNLPVKYSSSKFVYPLVSSSYANLKYQGNNKNFISNHKNHTDIASPPPKFFSTNRNITRLHPATFPHSTTDQPITYGTTTPQNAVTKNKFGPTKKYTASTTIRSTFRPVTKSSTSKPIVITTTTRRTEPTTLSTSTFVPRRPTTVRTTTTSSTTTTTVPPPTEPATTRVPSTTTVHYTTTPTEPPSYRPTEPATYRPIEPPSYRPTEPATYRPIEPQTYRPTEPQTYRPTLPTNLDAAEVYNSVGQKKDPSTMSLEDIFNAFAEDTFPNRTDPSEYLHENLPASPPSPFSIQTTPRQPVNIPSQTELTPQLNPVRDSNNYVQYKVQQPATNNGVQYHVPSMNSIMISPDQNSTSFVIGSQQSVGSSIFVGTAQKEPMFGNEQQIHYGTVINEQLSPVQGHTNAQQGPPLIHHAQVSVGQPSMTLQQGQFNDNPYHALPLSKPSIEKPMDTQENMGHSNFKFPSENAINGHGTPTGYGEITTGNDDATNMGTPANPIVFPKNEYPAEESFNNYHEAGKPVVFQQDDRPTETGEVLTLNQQKLLEKKYPRLPDSLTPPNRPNLQQWPMQRPQLTASTTNAYDFTRKPLTGLRRPNPDRPLPNILPQFRPNAKISHGHNNFNREPGNIRVPYPPGPNSNRPQNSPPVQPPFAHRRNPIMNRPLRPIPNRPHFQVALESMDNRRVYKVPPARLPPAGNRIYLQRQNRPPPLLLAPQKATADGGFGAQRHTALPEQYFSSGLEQPERLPVFEEEDFMTSDPPKPLVKKEQETLSMEPVVTLQMLKSHKKSLPPAFHKLHPKEPVAQPTAPQTLQGAASGQSPVYVVYPMQPDPDQYSASFGPETGAHEHVVVGHRGEQSPLPPPETNNKTPTQSFDYENTPFSVVREQAQEPILMVKNKSQPHDNGNFPYPLEKPDPAFAEFSKQQEMNRFERNGSIIEMSPRVVNRGSASESNSPIAVAYTPTEATHYYANHQPAGNKYAARPNLVGPMIPGSQAEALVSEDMDTRGQNYEKDFMAPFYPSISLSDISNVQQGWSVFSTPSTDNSFLDKNNINRIDLQGGGDAVSITTEKFDPNRFQPELQGGFKPIYPADHKNRDEEVFEEEVTENLVITTTTTAASAASSTTATIPSTQAASSTTTSDASTSTPRPKKSSIFSLESLLFGDDESYDEESDKVGEDNES